MEHRLTRGEKGKWSAEPTKHPRRPPVKIPEPDNKELIEEHKLTLIGRVTNPAIQKTRALVDFFLQHWRVTGTITGRDLGPHMFQFNFESEHDLQLILSKAPFHFKRWMMILQRWEPIVSDSFPALIPFWIKIHGIPLHYWSEKALKAIGKEIGPVEGFDVEQGRIRVLVNGLQPLEMKLDISVAGSIKQVELQYENLEKHCFACKALSHEVFECPTSKARANLRNSQTSRADISQIRTLEKLDADRKRRDEKKITRALSVANAHPGSVREGANQWFKPSYREEEGSQGRTLHYDYGIRRDPYHRSETLRAHEVDSHPRRPARERLSGSRNDILASHRTTHSRNSRDSQRSEWRPIADSSQSGTISKGNQSLYSHTPSPKPPREELLTEQERTLPTRQRSGDGIQTSNERRPALDRISQPAERIPLLQDGVANSASGRLQEVDIQYLEDTLPLPLRQSGGSNLPSSSKRPAQQSTGLGEGILDRSPIRTLSEDRLHVSLRLGPLQNSGSSKGSQRPDKDHEVSSPIGLKLGKEKEKTKNPPAARKRILRSPTQGVTPKKRRVTRGQSSPRRKLMSDAMRAGTRTSKPAAGVQPRTTIIPASRRKGSDFRTDPLSLP